MRGSRRARSLLGIVAGNALRFGAHVVSGAVFFAAYAPAGQPVGMLTLLSGKVRIVRNGETRAAQAAEFLYPGDRVISPAASYADFLYCPQLRAARISAGAEVSFGAADAKVVRGSLTGEWAIPACRLPATTALSIPSRQHLGVTRLRSLFDDRPSIRPSLTKRYDDLLQKGMVPYWPANTKTSSQYPSFRWSPVAGATSYELRFTDAEENVLWAVTVNEPQRKFPAVLRPLEWGRRYWWRMVARGPDGDLDEAGSYFELLPEARAEELQESAAELRRLAAKRPNDPRPRLALAFLYEEYGLLDQAAGIYARLASPDWARARFLELAVKLGWTPDTPPE